MRGNIGNLMKQAQAMQENIAKAQPQVAQLTANGESGGGMLKITMNVKHEVSRVQIEPPRLQVKHKDAESGSVEPSYDI